MKTKTVKRDQSRTGKSLIALIRHLEEKLKNPDLEIANKAASDLKEILLADAERKEKAAELALKQSEFELRQRLSAPANLDATVASLQAELASRKVAS